MNELAIQKPSTAGSLVHGTRAQIIVHSAVELIDCSKTIGAMLFKASRFGFKSAEDAECHALMCLMTGQDPMSCIQEVDAWQIIAGQRQMKFRAMLNRFLRVGGKVIRIERTPLRAEARLTRDGQTVQESFAWEDAKYEPYVWKKEAKINGGKMECFLPDGSPNPAALKDNWCTPRRRQQMLWARLITDVIGSLWSDIVGGAYIVNEVSDTEDDDVIDGEVVRPQATLPAPEPAPAPAPAPEPAREKSPPQASTTLLDDGSEDLEPMSPAAVAAAEVSVAQDLKRISQPQPSRRDGIMVRLRELHGLLNLEEDASTWNQLLSRFGAASAKDLNEEQADSLLGTLMERWEAKKLEDDAKAFGFSMGELAGQNP